MSLLSRVPGTPLEGDDLRAQGMDEGLIKGAEAVSKAVLKHMSPPGALGLPPLLEKRRLEMGLIDELFLQQATYQRLLLWALDPLEYEGGTSGDSGLYLPGKTIAREAAEAPRALIVSAGIDALDFLRSHGMDVGHIVTMCQECPYGIRVGIVSGKEFKLRIVDAGDIVASEDLGYEIREGRCEAFYDEGQNTHKYRDPRTGEPWSPEYMLEDREKSKKKTRKKAGKKAAKKTHGRSSKPASKKKASKKASKKTSGRTRKTPKPKAGY